jgi:hypothetical protein
VEVCGGGVWWMCVCNTCLTFDDTSIVPDQIILSIRFNYTKYMISLVFLALTPPPPLAPFPFSLCHLKGLCNNNMLL